eukprot:266453-Prymnesium_polylepis.1
MRTPRAADDDPLCERVCARASQGLRLHTEPFADGSRVSMQHARRGGPALYSPPPHLLPLLPPAIASDSAAAAECWAGAVVAR